MMKLFLAIAVVLMTSSSVFADDSACVPVSIEAAKNALRVNDVADFNMPMTCVSAKAMKATLCAHLWRLSQDEIACVDLTNGHTFHGKLVGRRLHYTPMKFTPN